MEIVLRHPPENRLLLINVSNTYFNCRSSSTCSTTLNDDIDRIIYFYLSVSYTFKRLNSIISACAGNIVL